ncbi:alpha/beta hydrolase [Sporosarcina sp. JAI121]|uniref:alpha/beta hydrolase n=1 Tax=Sporosarcina sp. JAI121 TaxID=2723064 RepID=UPI0015C74C74|nr:alpha/beta hydrolase [Sporosarcina sp. JAI121]NYF26116.1 pimeloyl-ACP methyl ester carboxylesterase [Sporosarcina sp. JAI121]
MLQYVQYNQENIGKTIIAIPALGERKEIFEALAKSLPEFRFVAIDLPGHNNYTFHEDYSIEKYVVDIDNLLDQLSISKAHFIGNSIGAWIIQNYYKNYPKSVHTLTLMDGGYYFIGDYEEIEIGEIELPIIEKLEDLQEAINQQVDSMDKLPSSSKELFENYLLKNFTQKDGVFVHHSNVNALNTLSKAVVEKNYCIQQTQELPVLLLLADQGKDNKEEEKINSFLISNNYATVERIPDSYHFLPITNTNDVSKHFKKLTFLLN